MNNIYEQLISHLDGIAVLLCLEKQEVFNDLKSHASIWLEDSDNAHLESLELYQKQIVEGSLVLGYGYFEGFLGDLAKLIIGVTDDVESKIEQKKKDILSYSIRRTFQGPMGKKLDWYKSLGFRVETEDRNNAIEASLVRNCIVHNYSRVSKELNSKYQNYPEGNELKLTTGKVHGFGITVRNVAYSLWNHFQL